VPVSFQNISLDCVYLFIYLSLAGTLKADQGPFGTGAHADGFDDTLALSFAAVCSVLDSTYTEGEFYLLVLGLYLTLEQGIGFVFCGIERHVGTARNHRMQLFTIRHYAVS